MKQLTILLALTMFANHAIAAQTKPKAAANPQAAAIAAPSSVSATTVLASADSVNQAAASNTAQLPATSNVGISYAGILDGVATDFHAAKTKDNGDMSISHRPSAKYKFSDVADAGLQLRFNTAFTEDGIKAANENSRIFANFKKLLVSDLGSLTLTPRLVFSNSKGSHDKGMLMAPDLIAQYSIEPKNSRLSFNVGTEIFKEIFKSSAPETGRLAAKQRQFYAIGIFEAAYQANSITQIALGFYPEATKNTNIAMHTTSNEVDLGVSVDVAKGWSVNPYIATELNQLADEGQNVLTSSSLCLAVSGTFL